MKNKNIIIVTVCIATALMCILLTFWGNWKNNGVLTTDAFIGVMATFIGVCATIIVGVQIVNHLELRNIKENIQTIEAEREQLEFERKAFSIEMYNTRLSVGNALALLAFTAQKSKDLVTEFNCWVHSIIIDDWSSMKGSALLDRYQRLVEIAKVIIPCSDNQFLESTYKKLSILVVPEEIEHYDEIMSLHYEMLSDLKARQSNQTTSTENV
jgi:hypothetical protein